MSTIADAEHDEVSPSARNPFTATFCWAKGQNGGAASLFPSRAPIGAILGRLLAGESIREVAVDFDVTEEAVHIVWQIGRDMRDYNLAAS